MRFDCHTSCASFFGGDRVPVMTAETIEQTPEVASRAHARLLDVAQAMHDLLSVIGQVRPADAAGVSAVRSLALDRPVPATTWQQIMDAPGFADDFRACLQSTVGRFVPSAEAADKLVRFARGSQMVVVGNDTGYWAHALGLQGGNVVASSADAKPDPRVLRWTDVHQVGIDRIEPFSGGASHRRTTILVDHNPQLDACDLLVRMTPGERLVVTDRYAYSNSPNCAGGIINRDFQPCGAVEIPRWSDQYGVVRMYRCVG